MLMSRTPTIAICKYEDRGSRQRDYIHVFGNNFKFFFWATPKRCSSSTITKPISLNRISFDNRRCVPITMSTVPFAKPSRTLVISIATEIYSTLLH